ncbi:MAG: putative sugar nucleotidyl transferase [Pirellulaceae bacterium]
MKQDVICLYEDAMTSRLRPMALGRPAYAIFCGGNRLWELVAELRLPLYGMVRDHLRDIQTLDYTDIQPVEQLETTGHVLLVNARLLPSCEVRETILGVLRDDAEQVLTVDGQIAMAKMRGTDLNLRRYDSNDAFQQLSQLPAFATLPRRAVQLPLLNHAHEVVAHHESMLAGNLAYRIEQGGYREIANGVFAAEQVAGCEGAAFDTSKGPVVLEAEVTLGPFSYLVGPVYVGRGTRVTERSTLKNGVAVGARCKIGGEVAASMMESYSNKQHDGFLGHSYIGSWVNLGAGTSNSDLKNTYGEIRVEYPYGRVATGLQFFGCCVGDYTKSAIQTGIFTGKLIGTCSMLYGMVTSNVPSFVNYAKTLGHVSEMSPDVVVAMQQRMWARRHRQQRSCDVQLLRDMHELTRDERATFDADLTVEPPRF